MAVCRECGSEDVVLYEDTEFGYATALTEIVRLTAKLAEARKPRWRRPSNDDHTSWELVLAGVVIAFVWFSCGTWNWQTLHGRGEGNLEFVKAAAEKAALGGAT